MNRIALCCMFGGNSTEYEVSLMSVTSVINNLNPDRYTLLLVGVTRAGKLYFYDGDPARIADDTWHLDKSVCHPAAFVPDPAAKTLLVTDGDRITARHRVDVVFPVMHGAYCEDGRLQGMLEFCGIPCVGPGCAASAAAMDKGITKLILHASGIRQAACCMLSAAEINADIEACAARAEAVSAYPLFVKPANAGSSVGVSKCADRAALLAGLRNAVTYDRKVLVEETIVGREVECAVFDGATFFAATPGEIVPGAAFYDYHDKYHGNESRYYIPARVTEKTLKTVRETAQRIFRTLGCRGLSRVDFFVRGEGEAEEVIFNEINTLPGFTSISMYPKMMMQDGMSYSALIDALVDSALGANA